MRLKNKKILLIIGGGIAAYKSLDLVRLLRKEKAEVKTIITKSGKEFVTTLSVASLSNNKPYEDIFDVNNESGMDHISLSRWADIILVVPTTANFMAKLNLGKAEDLATTVILASNKDIILVPAMNVRMWLHKATQKNLKNLQDYGYKFIGPVNGEMACGEYGEGKMSEPDKISNEINNYFLNLKKNKRLKALVTAGPTNEYIDPVRFITNKSSGKQGYEIAKSLSKKGFDTTLISGPTNLKIDHDVKLIEVETANEMFMETQKNFPADVAVFSAAVADFKVNKKYKNKIKKQDSLNLNLEKNVDILSYVSNHNSMRPELVIGFAAETDNVENNAEKKLNNKNCDWIVANDVSNKKIGFSSDFNEVTIYYRDKNKEKLSYKKKSEISDEIVDRIINQLN